MRQALSESSHPLVCTNGRPSAAALRLLTGLTEGGTSIHVRADDDDVGQAMVATVLSAIPDAKLWRFEARPPSLPRSGRTCAATAINRPENGLFPSAVHPCAGLNLPLLRLLPGTVSPSTATASTAATTFSTSRSAASSGHPQHLVRARPWKASGCTRPQLHRSQRLHQPRDGRGGRPLCVRGFPAWPTDGPQTQANHKRAHPEKVLLKTVFPTAQSGK
jgi:hypothetical protein